MTKANECTCPSGDGSLRHPCPAHPAVEQAGGDERAVDGKPRATKCPDCGDGDLMPGDLCTCGYETDPAAGYACSECDGSGDGYVGEVCRECDGSGWFVTPEQARAALAQPSGEVVVTKNESGAIVSVTRQDKEGRLLSVIAESQPSPAQAEQTEGFTHFPELLESVQQMDAMLKAEAERPIVSFEKYMQVMYARDENAKRLDAALARVAELEANLGAALGLLRESRGFVDRDNPLNESGQIKLLEEIDAFLNSPVAQVQHSVPRAWLDVQAERRRQVEVEGYHGFRDNHYINYELSKAARAYIEVSWHALSGGLPCKKPESWPWMAGFKWADGRTMLVKAGALILAEIERLDRAAAPGKEEV
ncbi:TPA: hypothetical protein ACRNCK_001176 [Pseudomonas aeruginosa]|uniref:hypothetical protein n=4 Tax=Pseudomonas aeruginosa TaxID=287 RepID=UPI0003B9CE1B|nr:hypothetical protein [Pseudomonas aeruginosa]EKX2292702.1 hypothetical protein [Pseudomonas aeruginosa]ELN4057438.1 hypothetical protein [Pseudomonas aeruginosa]ERW17707.1 hypothetical protein Q035_03426 [Pseudomonas aeruginosa BWHPSA022]ERW88281.1 hypothetical protein Q024_00376 [Pseudomonas aeruginosa BWHPSA011]MBH3485850.1 hypothetical protein [Pseudomonas aeruginosa]